MIKRDCDKVYSKEFFEVSKIEVLLKLHCVALENALKRVDSIALSNPPHASHIIDRYICSRYVDRYWFNIQERARKRIGNMCEGLISIDQFASFRGDDSSPVGRDLIRRTPEYSPFSCQRVVSQDETEPAKQMFHDETIAEFYRPNKRFHRRKSDRLTVWSSTLRIRFLAHLIEN